MDLDLYDLYDVFASLCRRNWLQIIFSEDGVVKYSPLSLDLSGLSLKSSHDFVKCFYKRYCIFIKGNSSLFLLVISFLRRVLN